LGEQHRDLVPFNSFAEPGRDEDGKSENVWFALNDDRPTAFFAGLWTTWSGTRKLKEGEITADLFAFLTTDANKEVGEIHPKAMPVILTEPEELELWMEAPWAEAGQLQRPLPDGSLQIVSRGGKSDSASS
jgi:putative SOS response-associated peptidase YedK